MPKKKKKEEVEPKNFIGYLPEEEPKPKRADYKKTIRFGKDRFGNPRSQRDFETTLRHILLGEERLKAWQAFKNGGTVTLVLKK